MPSVGMRPCQTRRCSVAAAVQHLFPAQLCSQPGEAVGAGARVAFGGLEDAGGSFSRTVIGAHPALEALWQAKSH